MNIECSIVKDLLPLYVENMVSRETAQFVAEHINKCNDCRADFESMSSGGLLPVPQQTDNENIDQSLSFKNAMRKINRQFNSMAYALVILLIFLGISWTGGENLMYNSLIMPAVGVFGYYVFKWKAVHKIPTLLAAVELFVCVFRLWDLDFHSAIIWTLIYLSLVFVGILIACLLHYAFRKEKEQ